MSELYQELIIDAYDNPQHQGKLDKPTASHKEFNASCGDEVEVFLQLDNDERIKNFSWQGSGCVISQATMSLLAEKILSEKMTINQVKKLEITDLEELIGVEKISPGRLKCLSLSLNALKGAIAKAN